MFLFPEDLQNPKVSLPLQPQKRYYRTEQARGAIAQLVEQRTEIPGGTTNDSVIKKSLELLKFNGFFYSSYCNLQPPIL